MKQTGEHGPIYGTALIDALPIGFGGMKQAMPSRNDLELSRKHGDRVAAGYEILLSHYCEAMRELERFKQKNA